MRWLSLVLIVSCHDEARAVPSSGTFDTPFSTLQAPSQVDTALAPLPQQLALDARKVALGGALFRDARLSGDGAVACADCHALDRGGADGKTRAQLRDRPPVAVNVPSVFNAAFNFRFGWAGGYEDIGDQIDFAMKAPAVMRGSWSQAATRLAGDASQRSAFASVYTDGLSAANLREVVAVYVLSLITPNSRFDRYLRGELTLAVDEQRGYALFHDHGCVSCHQGINVGGNMLQRFGVMRDYFAGREPKSSDLGLFAFTGRPEDRHVFRVPSLRNVALTAPYFHDASAETLEDAVVAMARYQLGRELSMEQASQISAFLRTLTGELDGRAL